MTTIMIRFLRSISGVQNFHNQSLSSLVSFVLLLSLLLLPGNTVGHQSESRNTASSNNDECFEATLISSLPYEAITKTTANATADFTNPNDKLSNTTCGIKSEGRGVWYRIDMITIIRDESIDGLFLEAKLVDASTSHPVDFNTAIFVGSSCNDMKCLLRSQYQITNQRTQPTSVWYAQNNNNGFSSYFYHIAGVDYDEVGSYNLFVTELEEYSNNVPVNDKCNNAVALTIGEEVRGDSTKSRPLGIVNTDCSLIPSSRGLFYSFQGTGTAMNVTLTTIIIDGDDSDLDGNIRLEVAILLSSSDDDDCHSSSSSSSNNDNCLVVSDFLTYEDTPHSILLEDTELDQTYVLVVSGEKFDDVGEFGILLVEEQLQQESNDASSSSSSSSNNGSLRFQ